MPETMYVGAIRAAVVAINRGDVDDYLRHFHPACPRWIAGVDQPLTLDDIGESLRQFHAAFEGLHLAEEALFGDGRFVCARWRLRGTQVNEYFGIAPSRQTIDVRTCEVYEFDGDVVTTVWTYGDPGELFRQLTPTVDAVSGD